MQKIKQAILTSNGGRFATLLVYFNESFLHDFVDLQTYVRNATEIGRIAEWLRKAQL